MFFIIKFPGNILVIFVIKKDLNILLVVLIILQQLEKINNSASPIGNYVNSLYQPETGSQTQRKIGTKVDVSVGAINRTNYKKNVSETT